MNPIRVDRVLVFETLMEMGLHFTAEAMLMEMFRDLISFETNRNKLRRPDKTIPKLKEELATIMQDCDGTMVSGWLKAHRDSGGFDGNLLRRQCCELVRTRCGLPC